MHQTPTPEAQVWEPLIFEVHPKLLTTIKWYYSSPTQWLRYIYANPNSHEVISLCFCFINPCVNLADSFTQLFSNSFCLKSDWKIVYLHLKHYLTKLHVTYVHFLIVSCKTINRLSKLHGSTAMTFSISLLSSNENRTTWSFSFLILKPFFDLQRGVKVFYSIYVESSLSQELSY